ncbi:hypothetical protein SteCoe_746 [Stentor coeruleus]|uniref:PARP-type domain-containing protein n=1 Tax=Stentor coeruleus TaxID=5963 RepID=A0A1R2D3M1_9CILI|nr:hypothetical protein SteCoe_746 [Stentor coeruleus]
MTRFYVDECPSNRTTCEVCKEKISRGEIRILHDEYMGKNLYYHLMCYTPKRKRFLKEKYFKILLSPGIKPLFLSWMNEWNSFYLPENIHSNVPSNISRAINTPASKIKRIYLEVFKFFSISEIINCLSLVCKDFYSTIWEPELWRCLYTRDFETPSIIPEDWKNAYLQEYITHCFHCKKKPEDFKKYECQLLKRVFCTSCLKNEKYKLLSESQVKNKYNVSLKNISKYIGNFPNDKVVIYNFLVVRAINKYRKQNKENILNKLIKTLGQTHQIVSIIDNINTNEMDINLVGILAPNYDCDIVKESYRAIFRIIRTGKREVKFSDLLSMIRKDFK